MSYKNKKYMYKKEEQPIMVEPIEQLEQATEDDNQGIAPIEDVIATKTYVTTSRLNLRSGASMDNDVITIIPKGEEVIHYNYSVGDWYYIKYKDYTGFCLKNWLQ